MNAPLDVKGELARRGRPLAPSLEQRRVRLYLFMVVLDAALILGAFGLVELLYLGRVWMLEGQLLLPLYFTIALYEPTYSIRSLQNWRFAAAQAGKALVIAATLLVFITFYTKSTAEFSRVVFNGGLVLTAALMIVSRRLLIRWLRHSWGQSVTNRLLIEAGGPVIAWPNGFRVDAAEHGIVPDSQDPQSLDRLGRYLLNMDRVVVSCRFADRIDWSKVLRASGVRGEIVTDRLDELAPIGLAVEDGWRSLVVSSGPLGLRQRALKRLFDIAVATGALVLLAPVMLLAALAIRLEDGGPVLFVQRRLGRGNRFFDMLKFRSMKVETSDHAGTRSTARDDDRTTRVGRFIRRTSIDELPQLINVLAGDMSVVGPRPHAICSQAGDKLFWEVDDKYWNRHSLKPGLTGLAQIRGHRGATDEERHLTDRLGADLEYIANWALWGDALIVLKTIGVITHPRAY
jgi:polysaccharide biosynthesis protein PslA